MIRTGDDHKDSMMRKMRKIFVHFHMRCGESHCCNFCMLLVHFSRLPSKRLTWQTFPFSTRNFCSQTNTGPRLEWRLLSEPSDGWKHQHSRYLHQIEAILNWLVAIQIFFIFNPNPGGMIQFDEHIFQGGWNHQLVNYVKGTVGSAFRWLRSPERLAKGRREHRIRSPEVATRYLL